jgi:hypothetical protein
MKNNDGFLVAIGSIFAVLLLVGLCFGIPTFLRYQRVMSAKNQVLLNEMKIKQTFQLVKVEQQKAQVAVAEAEGIAKAQRIINATLTDRYLQHEAIKAQERMANSPNHTQIYIPSGNNGIPLVKTLDIQEEKSK